MIQATRTRTQLPHFSFRYVGFHWSIRLNRLNFTDDVYYLIFAFHIRRNSATKFATNARPIAAGDRLTSRCQLRLQPPPASSLHLGALSMSCLCVKCIVFFNQRETYRGVIRVAVLTGKFPHWLYATHGWQKQTCSLDSLLVEQSHWITWFFEVVNADQLTQPDHWVKHTNLPGASGACVADSQVCVRLHLQEAIADRCPISDSRLSLRVNLPHTTFSSSSEMAEISALQKVGRICSRTQTQSPPWVHISEDRLAKMVVSIFWISQKFVDLHFWMIANIKSGIKTITRNCDLKFGKRLPISDECLCLSITLKPCNGSKVLLTGHCILNSWIHFKSDTV